MLVYKQTYEYIHVRVMGCRDVVLKYGICMKFLQKNELPFFSNEQMESSFDWIGITDGECIYR